MDVIEREKENLPRQPGTQAQYVPHADGFISVQNPSDAAAVEKRIVGEKRRVLKPPHGVAHRPAAFFVGVKHVFGQREPRESPAPVDVGEGENILQLFHGQDALAVFDVLRVQLCEQARLVLHFVDLRLRAAGAPFSQLDGRPFSVQHGAFLHPEKRQRRAGRIEGARLLFPGKFRVPDEPPSPEQAQDVNRQAAVHQAILKRIVGLRHESGSARQGEAR